MTEVKRRGSILPALTLLLFAPLLMVACQQANPPVEAPGGPGSAIAMDADDIAGTVTSANGPEAGVWVIAETDDLPTKFRKIVVTDEQGRFLLPDMPAADYRVFVRGYGLVDSQAVQAMPGATLQLNARIAPNAQAAAQVYPADYWYSLINVPAASEFPGTGNGPEGNGISPNMKTQADWISHMKAGCELCHQLGIKATREIPAALGSFESSIDAWDRRVRSGQDGAFMSAAMDAFGRRRALEMFADWSDRIADGEVPEAPPRPSGRERNLVLTMWDWGTDATFAHDEVTTDKRDPTVNADGPLYGVDYGTDKLLIVDPKTNTASSVTTPVRDPDTPSAKPQSMLAPSPYWGEQIYWTDPAHPHNPMMDEDGRVWITQAIRPPQNPAFCRQGSDNVYAKNFPLSTSGSQASVYDPKTGAFTLLDTCFSTHHLQFADDDSDTLYFSGDSNVTGWINTRLFDETGDAEQSQGWCPHILDTNGDGKIGEYTEPDEPVDPTRDHRISGFAYGIIVNPVDGSVWYAQPGVPGRIVRVEVGDDPPASCRTEVYEPPFHNDRRPGAEAYTPRGIDVDSKGVIWTALAGSGQMASFDRSKCTTFNGPTATGQQCPEGWTLYPAPGPQMKGVERKGTSDFFYYNWVDQHNALGLGEDIPIATGTGSDSLLVLQPDTGNWLVLRVPYPLGFYNRGLDGRIDDAEAGWKGRGLYADYGQNAIWHREGGKGSRSAVVKFQLRPDPLAH